jgi:hypothetical protein
VSWQTRDAAASAFEGRRLAGRGGQAHAVYWHRGYLGRDGKRVTGHWEALCGAWPRGESAGWVGPACEVTCPRCLAGLEKKRSRDAERAARAAMTRAKDYPGDPACSCRGAGCCACLSALPALDECRDCRHVSRCTALGFTSSPAERVCSFIPSRYRPLLPPGGGLGEGGPVSDKRVRLRAPEGSTEAVGVGGTWLERHDTNPSAADAAE